MDGMATSTSSDQKACEEDENQTESRSRTADETGGGHGDAERLGHVFYEPGTSELRRTDWETTRPGGVYKIPYEQAKATNRCTAIDTHYSANFQGLFGSSN
jgi:hypothetical protein